MYCRGIDYLSSWPWKWFPMEPQFLFMVFYYDSSNLVSTYLSNHLSSLVLTVVMARLFALHAVPILCCMIMSLAY